MCGMSELWDAYLVVGNELLRVGLESDRGGGITDPLSALEVGPGVRGLHWLDAADRLAIYADDRTVITDRTLSEHRQLPADLLVSDAGELAFSLEGAGPAKDVVVNSLADPSARPLTLSGLQILRSHMVVSGALDALLVIDGDPWTSQPRRLLVIPLAGIRALIGQGVTSVARDALDFDAIDGASEFVPLDDRMHMVDVPGHPAFLCRWNFQIPQQIPHAQVAVFEYLDRDAGEAAPGRQGSGPIPLDQFFLADLVVGRTASDGLTLCAVGAVQKAKETWLALRTLSLEDPGGGLRFQLSADKFVSHAFPAVQLRDSGSVRAVTGLPNGTGALARVEDPSRREQLIRVDLRGGNTQVHPYELARVPELFCVAPGGEAIDVTEQASYAPRDMSQTLPLIEAVDVDLDLELDDAEDVGVELLDEPISEVVVVESLQGQAADGAAGWLPVLEGGPTPIMPGTGLDLEVGQMPVDAHLSASVAAVGGNAGAAALRHWFSQSDGLGVATFWLHVRTETVTNVRYSVRRLA